MKHGSPYGTHRVIEPLGVLPQGAWKIDNTMEMCDNEILIDVSALNIDSAHKLQFNVKVCFAIDCCYCFSKHLCWNDIN